MVVSEGFPKLDNARFDGAPSNPPGSTPWGIRQWDTYSRGSHVTVAVAILGIKRLIAALLLHADITPRASSLFPDPNGSSGPSLSDLTFFGLLLPAADQDHYVRPDRLLLLLGQLWTLIVHEDGHVDTVRISCSVSESKWLCERGRRWRWNTWMPDEREPKLTAKWETSRAHKSKCQAVLDVFPPALLPPFPH